MNDQIEKIIVDIITSEMKMNPDNVWVDNQTIIIPNTDDLFITVGMVDAQLIMNRNRYETTASTITEVQEVVERENIQIDLISRTDEARERRYEVLMALKSILSQQKQEVYNFRIFSIPTSFVKASEAEGGSNLNRFSVTIACHVWYQKKKALPTEYGDYYEEFSLRGDAEDTVVQSWNSQNTYNEDDVVYYAIDRKYYICLNDGVTSVPTDETDWEETAEPKQGAIEFTISTT